MIWDATFIHLYEMVQDNATELDIPLGAITPGLTSLIQKYNLIAKKMINQAYKNCYVS